MAVKKGQFRNVLLVGFEGSTLHTLEYFFQSHKSGKKYKIVNNPKQAHWAIFNADQPQTKESLQTDLASRIMLPAVVISFTELDWENSVTLRKPFSVKDLESAIEALFNDNFHEKKNENNQSDTIDSSFSKSPAPAPAPAEKEAPKKADASGIKEKQQKPKIKQTREITGPSSQILIMPTVFGHLPELDWTIDADQRRLHINPDGMLLPWIKKTYEEGRKQNLSFSIDGLHLRLEYLPWTDCFITNLSEEVLYTVMTSRFGLGELSIKPGDVIEDDILDGLDFSERIMKAEDLMWLAGLWTVQGRILPGDDPTKPRRLLHVPDFIKKIEIPEIKAVIDLWQSRSMSAFEIISELNIPQRYVFGIMAAATTAMQFEY